MLPTLLGALKSSDLLISFVRWFDAWAGIDQAEQGHPKRIDWARCIPFVAMHVACGAVIWVGWSWAAVIVAALLYAVRMFAITAFYHRYFSHRAFKTSRWWQFTFGALGASAAQRGPLWWAAHHRNHHRYSDSGEDLHSPHQHGFLWSHMGWITSRANFRTRLSAVSDLEKYPELRFLDRFDVLVPAMLCVGLYAFGEWLAASWPEFGTNGAQMVVWGFFISTLVLFHCTNTINSLSHMFGRRRYETRDQSRNNWLLALLTFGEGWHNNHHRYPASARQGFFWWELDLSYYGLVLLSWVGVVWDLNPVPEHIRRIGSAPAKVPLVKAN